MRKAWLIAWREISQEVFGDRGSVLRSLLFALMPIFFAFSARGGRGEQALVIFALQSALVPAITGVTLIASTFTAEKENQTIVPLLAAPVRDLDVVVGKLVGMLIPVTGICVLSVALYYGVSVWLHGAARVARALPPEFLFSCVMLAFFYVLTAGSWVMIVAARVRTSRGAQQMAGLLIGLSLLVLGTAVVIAVNLLDGWGLVVLALIVLVADVVALDLARRAWQRGEVIARI